MTARDDYHRLASTPDIGFIVAKERDAALDEIDDLRAERDSLVAAVNGLTIQVLSLTYWADGPISDDLTQRLREIADEYALDSRDADLHHDAHTMNEAADNLDRLRAYSTALAEDLAEAVKSGYVRSHQ